MIQLGSVRWRVDFTLSSSELREVNEPLVHLTFNLRDGERGGTAAVPVALSADKLRVLLAGEARGGGGSRDPGPGRGDAPLPPPPPSLLRAEAGAGPDERPALRGREKARWRAASRDRTRRARMGRGGSRGQLSLPSCPHLPGPQQQAGLLGCGQAALGEAVRGGRSNKGSGAKAEPSPACFSPGWRGPCGPGGAVALATRRDYSSQRALLVAQPMGDGRGGAWACLPARGADGPAGRRRSGPGRAGLGCPVL